MGRAFYRTGLHACGVGPRLLSQWITRVFYWIKMHDFVIISWSCWCFVLLNLRSFLHRRYSHLAPLTELGSRRSIVAHGAAAGKWFPSEACSSWRGEFGTRIHQNSGRARVSKCFKSPWHWVNDTAFGKVFLQNCPCGYILVKLNLPQNSWCIHFTGAVSFFIPVKSVGKFEDLVFEQMLSRCLL